MNSSSTLVCNMWKVIGPATSKPIFTRPLGLTEQGFHLSATPRGTGDFYQLVAVSVGKSSLLLDTNVIHAWSSVKRRFPLLAARISTVEGKVSFVVEATPITHVRPEEITFTTIPSIGVPSFVHGLLDGPRPLSDALLARVYVIRHPNRVDKLHILFVTTHVVIDLKSGSTLIRTFLDALTSMSEAPYPPLSDRLAMVPTCEVLWPCENITTARRRWRKALGFAIFAVRMARFRGGNAFPRKATSSPVCSRMLATNVPSQSSDVIFSNCRTQGITFGNAFNVLTQVAMYRVLHKLRLTERLSEDAWQYHIYQPTYTHGPLDLRSRLNSEWYRNGGGGEVFLAISFFYYSLPCIPMSPVRQGHHPSELPPFSKILTKGQFMLRCRVMQVQARRFLKHPLFLEITTGAHLAHVADAQSIVNDTSSLASSNDERGDMAHGAYDGGMKETVFAYGTTSIGVLDELLLPRKYPLNSDDPLSPMSPVSHPAKAGLPSLPPVTARPPCNALEVHIDDWQPYLQCQPGELYIASGFVHGQLAIKVFFDSNAYDEAMVQEWIDEVKAACIWYLGDPSSQSLSRAQSRL